MWVDTLRYLPTSTTQQYRHTHTHTHTHSLTHTHSDTSLPICAVAAHNYPPCVAALCHCRSQCHGLLCMRPQGIKVVARARQRQVPKPWASPGHSTAHSNSVGLRHMHHGGHTSVGILLSSTVMPCRATRFGSAYLYLANSIFVFLE